MAVVVGVASIDVVSLLLFRLASCCWITSIGSIEIPNVAVVETCIVVSSPSCCCCWPFCFNRKMALGLSLDKL